MQSLLEKQQRRVMELSASQRGKVGLVCSRRNGFFRYIYRLGWACEWPPDDQGFDPKYCLKTAACLSFFLS